MLSRARLKRKKKLRKVSKKRASELKKYAVLRDKFLRDQPWCEIGTTGCSWKATEIHHSMRRVGKYLNDPEYWFATCRNCHSAVHNDPAWARAHLWIQT